MIKKFLKKYLPAFRFFYSYLRFRIFLGVGLSLLVGVLDGFGLSMFLPLLQIVENKGSMSPEELGGLQFLVDGIESSGVNLTIGSVLILMVSFFALKGIASFAQYYYRVSLQQDFIRKVRLSAIERLNAVSYTYFIQSDAGRLQNSLGAESERVSKAYQSYFLVMQNLIMVLVYMVFAFSVNPQFALLVTIGGGVTNFLYTGIYKTTKGTSRRITEKSHDFQGYVSQYIQNFKYLKATATLSSYGAKLKKMIESIENDNKKVGVLMGILNASREPLVISVVALVIFIQTNLYGVALGGILVSLLFFYRALSYLMQMQSHANFYLSVSGSLHNMEMFLEELSVSRQPNGQTSVQTFSHTLEIAGGTFSYGKEDILSDLNLAIRKNETWAFVGHSGSGKTTLINLLCGLLPLSKGKFSIDGIPSGEMNLPSFQKRIGYITQDPVIFQDTVFNNVTLWDEPSDANHARFRKALEQSAAADFVNALPEREATILIANGANLSGGQKQRISIARELYKDIDILILDEATSALDSQTEREIQENFALLKGKYTLIVIAHRLSTIRFADKIVLLKDGRIESIDSFKRLMESSATFNEMVSLQELK